MNVQIKQITLQGTPYYAELNMVCLEEFLEQEGKDLKSIGDYLGDKSISNMAKLLHFMISYGHRVMGVDFDLTFDQVAVLLGFDVDIVADYIMKCMPDLEEKKKAATSRSKKPKK